MEPDQNAPGQQPTSMSGSNWQRQALTAARAGAAAANHADAASPTVEAAQQRAAAQQVPDMLAAADPVPAQPVQPQQPQQPQPVYQEASGDTTGRPVVSGALAPDGPDAGAPVIGTGGPSTGKKLLVVVGMIVLVLGLAAGAYLIFFANKHDSINAANEKSQNTAESSAIDVSTLQNITFVAPANMSGYTKNTAASKDNFSSYSATGTQCKISFGTVQPGPNDPKTAEDMINAVLNNVRSAGGSVDGPDAKGALVLRDADDASISYKMPTITYTFRKDNAMGTALYSIAFMKDGNLAIVSRDCSAEGAELADDALDPYDQKVHELTIRVTSTAP